MLIGDQLSELAEDLEGLADRVELVRRGAPKEREWQLSYLAEKAYRLAAEVESVCDEVRLLEVSR